MKRYFHCANRRVSFGGAATLLIMTALMSQALGFLRNRLISTNFTVTDPGSSDAFFAAFQIPDFFFYTIAAGALGVAFMPILAEKLHLGDSKAISSLTSSLLNVMALAMAAISLIIFVFAKPLIHTLAPNLPPDHLHEAVNIMRIIAFNPLLFTMSGILTTFQQTYGRFFFYAIAPIVYNISIIVSIFVFRDGLGIVGLGVGALIGAILQLLISVGGLGGLGFKYRPKIIWEGGFREVLRHLPARSIDQGIDQVNSIVETNRAQNLGVGPVSYYNYATTLQNVPIMLLGNSIATAAFPRLVDRLAQNRPDLFRRDFTHILRMIIWAAVPVVIIGYFCRGYLARLIFGDVAPEVALIFGYLTASIFFRIIYTMISRWFYAQKDTKTPLYVSIFAIGLNIYLAFTLARGDAYGISGLALAQSLTAVAEVIVLSSIMFYRDKALFNDYLRGGLAKIISVTGFTLLTAFTMITLLPLSLGDRGFVTLGSKLGIITLVTLTTHLCISVLLGLEEARVVLDRVKQIILKPIRIQ